MEKKTPTKTLKIRCAGCQEVIELEWGQVGKRLVCEVCRVPINWKAYPALVGEAEGRREAAAEEIKQYETKVWARRQAQATARKLERADAREHKRREPAEQVPPNLPECRTCGHRVSPNATVCPSCGEKCPSPEAQRSLRRTLLIMGGLWLSIMVFIVGLIALAILFWASL